MSTPTPSSTAPAAVAAQCAQELRRTGSAMCVIDVYKRLVGTEPAPSHLAAVAKSLLPPDPSGFSAFEEREHFLNWDLPLALTLLSSVGATTELVAIGDLLAARAPLSLTSRDPVHARLAAFAYGAAADRRRLVDLASQLETLLNARILQRNGHRIDTILSALSSVMGCALELECAEDRASSAPASQTSG